MRPHAAALKALLEEPRLQIMPGCGDGMGALGALGSASGGRWRSKQTDLVPGKGQFG
jgi:hypothetical protein